MEFRYFTGPESEMRRLLAEPDTCTFCGLRTRCFELPDHSGVGCYGCLRAGRFGFFHQTEVGYVDQTGLRVSFEEDGRRVLFVVSPDGKTDLAAAPVLQAWEPQRVTAEAVYELWRTPGFPTWNDVGWPVHCREFMTYLGEWQPKDFPSRAAFLEMTESEYHPLWREGESLEEWGVTCYAFRCPECGKFRGIVDFS